MPIAVGDADNALKGVATGVSKVVPDMNPGRCGGGLFHIDFAKGMGEVDDLFAGEKGSVFGTGVGKFMVEVDHGEVSREGECDGALCDAVGDWEPNFMTLGAVEGEEGDGDGAVAGIALGAFEALAKVKTEVETCGLPVFNSEIGKTGVEDVEVEEAVEVDEPVMSAY